MPTFRITPNGQPTLPLSAQRRTATAPPFTYLSRVAENWLEERAAWEWVGWASVGTIQMKSISKLIIISNMEVQLFMEGLPSKENHHRLLTAPRPRQANPNPRRLFRDITHHFVPQTHPTAPKHTPSNLLRANLAPTHTLATTLRA